MVYITAWNGTQKIKNKRSAAAKFNMNKLVVFLKWSLFMMTTIKTSKFPIPPRTTMTEKTTGTMILSVPGSNAPSLFVAVGK